jgi:hypothetical protein
MEISGVEQYVSFMNIEGNDVSMLQPFSFIIVFVVRKFYAKGHSKARR